MSTIFSYFPLETAELKCELSSKFKVKDLGQLKHCLGMRVNIDKQNKRITLDQSII